MQYRYLVVALLVSLSACTYQIQVITPEPTSALEVTSTQPVETLTPNPLPPSTFTFTPTMTASPLPADDGKYPVRFPPNGTYLDIVDSLSAGTSKTYSFSASEGQMMSVSVNQSQQGDRAYIPIQIIGADGKILCEVQQNKNCYFWRGILPVTQECFLTLSPEVDVTDFTIRVAINPPGTVNQSFQYASKDGYISFTYTDEFAPAYPPSFQVTRDEPEVVLAYIDTQAFDNTNLYEAYILFNASTDGTIVQTCTQPVSMGGPEEVIGKANINGVSFIHSEGGGAATGNFYEQSIYRTFQHGTCYEMIFVVHSFSTDAFMPQVMIDEYDRDALIQKFDSILSSLVIK